MTSEWTRTILFALILAHYRGGTIDFKNVSKIKGDFFRFIRRVPALNPIEGIEPSEVFEPHANIGRI